MPRPPLLYRLAAAGATVATRAAALVHPGLAATMRARRESDLHFHNWATWRDASAHTLVLVHASSAGELRQAEPVIRRLRARHPDWQLGVTWFSPSARLVAEELPVDVFGFLPWDRPGLTGRWLDALRPAAIAVCHHDLWPELAWQAERRKIPVALFAGTVRAESRRLRWPAAGVLRRAYGTLVAAGAVSDEDAARLRQLGVPPDRMSVLGDPRVDGALERVERWPGPERPMTMLVAGSTWPADDAILLPAFADVRRTQPGARLLIVPHRPGPEDLARLARAAAALGLPAPSRLADAADDGLLLICDEVGQLARLYGGGSLAYVGGGFGKGLHSVIEPAAWGRPVLMGPRAAEVRAARALVAVNAGCIVADAAELARAWSRWLGEVALREAAATAAREFMTRERGAADRSAALVERLV